MMNNKSKDVVLKILSVIENERLMKEIDYKTQKSKTSKRVTIGSKVLRVSKAHY